MRFSSLKARLFSLILFSSLLLAVPVLIYCGITLEHSELERQKDSIRESCSLMHSIIINRLFAQLDDNIQQAAVYRSKFQLAAGIVDSLIGDIRDADVERERLDSIKAGFAQKRIYCALYKKGTGFVYGDTIVTRQFAEGICDTTGQPMSLLLTEPVVISDADIQFYTLNMKGLNLAAKNENVAMLTCIHHIDTVRTIVFSYVLPQAMLRPHRNEKRFLSDIQEGINRIHLPHMATVALVSRTQGVRLSSGAAVDDEQLTSLVKMGVGTKGAYETIYTYKNQEYYGRTFYIPQYGLCAVATIPLDAVMAPIRLFLLGIALICVIALCLGLLAVYQMASEMVRPILDVTAKADMLAHLNFTGQKGLQTLHKLGTDIPTDPKDEAGRLALAFGRMANELESSIGNALNHMAERKRIEGELAAAKQMQMAMLSKPNDFYTLSGAYISSYIRPAREVGGDFYDAVPLDNGRIAFVIGDVSGKGVAASLFMAMSVAHVRQALHAGQTCAQAMETVNANLAEGNDSLMFVTLFIGILNTVTGHFEYCSGGHCPPAVLQPAAGGTQEPGRAGRVRYLRAVGGPLVGVFPEASYVATNDILAPGECCLLYTDGVTEAKDCGDVLFGEKRLTEALALSHGPEDATANVVHAVDTHSAEAGQTDDITMLCFGCCHTADAAGEGDVSCNS